eukprot:scaffold12880_cov22-Tisochrysis_lutea.AAC.4
MRKGQGFPLGSVSAAGRALAFAALAFPTLLLLPFQMRQVVIIKHVNGCAQQLGVSVGTGASSWGGRWRGRREVGGLQRSVLDMKECIMKSDCKTENAKGIVKAVAYTTEKCLDKDKNSVGKGKGREGK